MTLTGSVTDVIAAIQSRLGCHSRWVPAFRLAVLPPLDAVARRYWTRPLVRRKALEDYVCTVDLSPHDVGCAVAGPYHRNLLATKKYRRLAGGIKQWETGSWRHVDADNRRYQGHLYYFPSAVTDGATDLYHHREVNYVVDPKGHENEPQQAGDPQHTLRDALDAAGVAWSDESVQLADVVQVSTNR